MKKWPRDPMGDGSDPHVGQAGLIRAAAVAVVSLSLFSKLRMLRYFPVQLIPTSTTLLLVALIGSQTTACHI